MSAASLKLRISMLLAFSAVAAATWMMRAVFVPADEPARVPEFPARRAPSSSATVKTQPESEPYSVKLGLVPPPDGGEPAQVSAAFAAALQKLLPAAQDAAGAEADSVRQLFADWWQLDPAAALRFVSEPPGVFTSRGGLFLLPLIAARDPRRAWTLTTLAQQPADRMKARMEVMRAWAHRVPHEAMSFAASLSGTQRGEAERAALDGWAARDAAAALAWVAALPEGWRRGEMMKQYALAATESDPATLAAALRRGTVSAKTLSDIFSYRHEHGADPATVIARAAIASDPDPLGFCVVTSEKGLTSLAAAAWSALLERDGAITAESIGRIAAGVPEKGQAAFAAALGAAAPEAGLAWALEHGAPLPSLATAWARLDPEAALSALQKVSRSPEIIGALRAAAYEARESAPVAVLQLMASLPAKADDDHAREDLHDMVKRAAFSDPVRTLEALHAMSTVTPEEVSMVLAAGGSRDPLGTAAALARVELPVTDTVAAESFTRGWAAADAAAASVWARELPPGDLRDGAAAGLAHSAARTDPAGAFAWAVEVTAPDMRQRVLRTVIESAAKSGTPLEPLLNEPRLTAEERGTLRAHAASATPP